MKRQNVPANAIILRDGVLGCSHACTLRADDRGTVRMTFTVPKLRLFLEEEITTKVGGVFWTLALCNNQWTAIINVQVRWNISASLSWCLTCFKWIVPPAETGVRRPCARS